MDNDVDIRLAHGVPESIHWFRRGVGTSCIFLHGFTGHVKAWQDVVDCLAPNLSVGALLIPGHYPQAPVQSSFSTTCDYLARCLAVAKIEPTILVGYSLGARLALGIAVRYAHLVKKLVLIGGHFGLENNIMRHQRKQDDLIWQKILLQQGIAAFVEQWEQQPIFASQISLDPQKRDNQRQHRLAHSPQALAACLASCGLGTMPNFWPQLTTVAMPVALITGSGDQKYSLLAQRAHSLFPHSTSIILEGCGHNPLLEQPHSVAQALARFIV